MKRIDLLLGFLGLLALGCTGGGGGGNGGSGGGGGAGGAGGGGAGGGGAAGGGVGGSPGCTEIGCDDGFTLTLEAGNGTFTPGQYTLDTNIDGTMATCTMTIGAMVDSTCN